ncbi:MAG: DUF6379 domain-containing protein [Lachnospiraceae bacterium]|jgi:hypothetical protein|nr:DUF6379 domain-containing protein [Lachnospiraceae bacterium]
MDRQVIQSTGFHNIKDEEGKVVGFTFRVRLPYYRGIYLSQLRPGSCFVDGEKFTKDEITWVFNGEEYTWQELAEDFHTHWVPNVCAAIRVKKEGGLAQGFHDIKYGYSFESSYMPPMMESDEALNPDAESPIFMPEFGHHVNERRLLIV